MDASNKPGHELVLEVVRVTEAAAIAAGRWAGSGDKNGADGAAVAAMRGQLETVAIDGVVIIGEGEKDEAPMLFNGERVGSGAGPAVDVAVDPIDGTTLLSLGRQNSVSVMTVSESGSMFDPGPCVYMEKIAVGPKAAGAVDMSKPVAENIKSVAAALRKDVHDVVAVILDRERHAGIIREVREVGAKARLIPDGDVAGALATAVDYVPGDILIGIGGTPEGVIAAGALKCLGGELQGRLWPRNGDERDAALEAGYELDRILTTDDMVSGDHIIFAVTGITDGEFVAGVKYGDSSIQTETIVMNAPGGTIRRIEAERRIPAS